MGISERIMAGAASPLDLAVRARDRDTVSMVAEAVAARRLRLAFQPVVIAADTGRTGFYEGLIRVLDPTGRIIPARDFIDAVDPTETGRELDCAALALGLQALADRPDLRLSINLSARSVGYGRWMRVLQRGLRGRDDIGPRLILEMAETSVMQMPEVIAAFMADMRRHGISFALDGFGGGMTSLKSFRELAFDMVKTDAAFSRGIEGHSDNQTLMGALLAVARQFDMLAVAQGVETEAEASWLAALGVDCLQGHAFAAPSLRLPD